VDIGSLTFAMHSDQGTGWYWLATWRTLVLTAFYASAELP
jgi:hypothetical protein